MRQVVRRRARRVGHRHGQRAAGGRRVGGIGVGQVLDQRIDCRRSGAGVEGDRERRAGVAAGGGADRDALIADVAAA